MCIRSVRLPRHQRGHTARFVLTIIQYKCDNTPSANRPDRPGRDTRPHSYESLRGDPASRAPPTARPRVYVVFIFL